RHAGPDARAPARRPFQLQGPTFLAEIFLLAGRRDEARPRVRAQAMSERARRIAARSRVASRAGFRRDAPRSASAKSPSAERRALPALRRPAPTARVPSQPAVPRSQARAVAQE